MCTTLNDAIEEATITSMHNNKLFKSIELYINESPLLIKKCMLLAGFDESDLKENGSLYTHFLGMALEYEFYRLELLKSGSLNERIEMKSSLLSDSVININSTTNNNNCISIEKMKKALTIYKFDSCLTMVKYMIEVGLNPSETEVHHPSYLLCLENALQYEHYRWRYHRSNFRKTQNKSRNLEGTETVN